MTIHLTKSRTSFALDQIISMSNTSNKKKNVIQTRKSGIPSFNFPPRRLKGMMKRTVTLNLSKSQAESRIQ